MVLQCYLMTVLKHLSALLPYSFLNCWLVNNLADIIQTTNVFACSCGLGVTCLVYEEFVYHSSCEPGCYLINISTDMFLTSAALSLLLCHCSRHHRVWSLWCTLIKSYKYSYLMTLRILLKLNIGIMSSLTKITTISSCSNTRLI